MSKKKLSCYGDRDWHVSTRKKPVAYSTVATAELVASIARAHPTLTFEELRCLFNDLDYMRDPEIEYILDQIIKYGDGELNAHRCMNLRGLQQERERVNREKTSQITPF